MSTYVIFTMSFGQKASNYAKRVITETYAYHKRAFLSEAYSNVRNVAYAYGSRCGRGLGRGLEGILVSSFTATHNSTRTRVSP